VTCLGPDPLLPDLCICLPLAADTFTQNVSEKVSTIGTKMHKTTLLRNLLESVGIGGSGGFRMQPKK
jgi:hypothetical protein